MGERGPGKGIWGIWRGGRGWRGEGGEGDAEKERRGEEEEGEACRWGTAARSTATSTGDSREVEEVVGIVDRDGYAWIYNAAFQPLNKLETGECSTNVSDIRVRHSTSSIKLSRSIVDKDSTSALREDFTTMKGSHFCVTKDVPMTLPWIPSLNDG